MTPAANGAKIKIGNSIVLLGDEGKTSILPLSWATLQQTIPDDDYIYSLPNDIPLTADETELDENSSSSAS